MQIPATSSQWLFVPLSGPPGTDLTLYPVLVCLYGETDGEPAPGDYLAADWTRQDARYGKATAGVLIPAGQYPDGSYMAWATFYAADGEVPVFQSGRVRVGDGGT